MERLFGEGDHFITHYNLSPGPKTWNSEVFFGGRYVLTLQVEVEIDYNKGDILKTTGTPIFYLSEVKSVEIEKSGRSSSTRFSRNWDFGEAVWNKLVAASGDWSAIGFDVRTNAPVENFEFYVANLRGPRIRVAER